MSTAPKRVAVAEARAYFRDLVDEVQRTGSRVKITRYGKTLACIVPIEDAQLLDECRPELEDCGKRKRASGERRRR